MAHPLFSGASDSNSKSPTLSSHFTIAATITQSDSHALEHILSIILLKPPHTVGSITIPPFCACFSKAEVSNAYDFIAMEPNAYGPISFAITSSGDEYQQLNIIKVKKSTPSSLGITKSPLLWYLLCLTLMIIISRSAALVCLQYPIQAHCCYHLVVCQALPLPYTTSG
jgi:hypothetical protein